MGKKIERAKEMLDAVIHGDGEEQQAPVADQGDKTNQQPAEASKPVATDHRKFDKFRKEAS